MQLQRPRSVRGWAPMGPPVPERFQVPQIQSFLFLYVLLSHADAYPEYDGINTITGEQ